VNSSNDQIPTIPRKPRLALFGEFSAGKSTLTNLLTGQDALPVRVTATRLPPVWISKGPQSATIVGQDGTETPVDLDGLEEASVESAALIRVQMNSETLELCDIIDMPGISDPNMAASVWEAVAHEADSVVWCTHATQAWRQSEAAVWEKLSESIDAKNILLLTHIDKLQTERERERVLQRVQKEAGDLFDGIFPVALIEAVSAGEDEEKWNQSGAGPFVEFLIETLMDPRLRNLTSPVQPSPKPAAASVTRGGGFCDRERSGGGSISPKRVRLPETSERGAGEVPGSAASGLHFRHES